MTRIVNKQRRTEMAELYDLIIVGAGNLGQALANYMNFEKRGFFVKGIFDKKESLIGTDVRGMKVMHTDEIASFIKENNIDIAVLTLPKQGATEIVKTLVTTDITGIWNFAHVDLDVPDHINVENVHLSDSLMKLSFKIHENEA